MVKIADLTAYKIVDGNGYFTAQVKLTLSNGEVVRASSSFSYASLYQTARHGQAADRLLEQLRKILFPRFLGWEIDEAAAPAADNLLQELRASNKQLEANACFLLSTAVARAAARVSGQELYHYLNNAYQFEQKIYCLPTPLFNMFNGGKYGDTNLDFEEFLLVPLTKNRTSFLEKVECGAAVFHALAAELAAAGYDTDVGSEGGYAPDMTASLTALDLLVAACRSAGYEPGREVGLGVDVGAGWLYDSQAKRYIFRLDHNQFSSANLTQLYEEWQRRYHLVYLEDGLAGVDLVGWKELSDRLRQQLILAGDDLFANSLDKLRRGLKDRLANAVVIKLDNVFTLTEIAVCLKLAAKHNYQTIISCGYSETNDTFSADLAVAAAVDFIKAGSLARGERNGKINRLLEIEQDLAR